MRVELPYAVTKARSLNALDLRWFLLALLTLLTVSLVTYVPRLYSIGLYQDDWRNLGDLVLQGQISKTARPLNLAVLTWGWNIFGLNIHGYLVTAVLLHFLAALMFWLLLYVLLPRTLKPLALLIAVLYLVYPSYYVRLWLTLWPSGLLVAIFLAGALAFVVFLHRGQLLWWTVSILLFAASLLWYELQLMLIAIVPLLGVSQFRRGSWTQRLFILGPTILAGAFLLWLLFAPTGNQEYPTSNLVFSLLELGKRLVRAYWTVLVVAWIEPIRFLGPQPLPRWEAVVIFAAVMLATVLIAYVLLVKRKSSGESDASFKGSDPRERGLLLWSAALAFLAIGLGLLPGLPLYEIGVAILVSRFTLFAALGAAAFVVFAVFGLARLLTSHHQLRIRFAYTVGTVMVVLAILYQWGAQSALAAGWEHQRCAWLSMLTQAPAFEDGTHVHVLDVPAPVGIWGVSPFQFIVLDMDAALKLIYDNPSLIGTFAHTGNRELVTQREFLLTPEGIQDSMGILIPYNEAVIFRYRADDSLELLKEVPTELTGANRAQPTGINRIRTTKANSRYERIIEPFPSCAYSS